MLSEDVITNDVGSLETLFSLSIVTVLPDQAATTTRRTNSVVLKSAWETQRSVITRENEREGITRGYKCTRKETEGQCGKRNYWGIIRHTLSRQSNHMEMLYLKGPR